ncbi:MAG: hypothetical protein DMG06_24030 [Acidobacteria bacterium]|nr:MAG: hypothetical protein DMG06_24030 [Acidobacteriota bacterium]
MQENSSRAVASVSIPYCPPSQNGLNRVLPQPSVAGLFFLLTEQRHEGHKEEGLKWKADVASSGASSWTGTQPRLLGVFGAFVVDFV